MDPFASAPAGDVYGDTSDPFGSLGGRNVAAASQPQPAPQQAWAQAPAWPKTPTQGSQQPNPFDQPNPFNSFGASQPSAAPAGGAIPASPPAATRAASPPTSPGGDWISAFAQGMQIKDGNALHPILSRVSGWLAWCVASLRVCLVAAVLIFSCAVCA